MMLKRIKRIEPMRVMSEILCMSSELICDHVLSEVDGRRQLLRLAEWDLDALLIEVHLARLAYFCDEAAAAKVKE